MVAELVGVESLPDVPEDAGGAMRGADVARILAEDGCTRAALIEYDIRKEAGMRFIFAALEYGRGEWRDLRGNYLRVTRL